MNIYCRECGWLIEVPRVCLGCDEAAQRAFAEKCAAIIQDFRDKAQQIGEECTAEILRLLEPPEELKAGGKVKGEG